MPDEFQRAYNDVRTALRLGPVGSSQYRQLLALWHTLGEPSSPLK
jgi:hypothetical protein